MKKHVVSKANLKVNILLLLLILPIFVLSSPLRVAQAKTCCLKHSTKCSMHHGETDKHCKGNTYTEIQCCEDKCYPNLKYIISEKPSNQIKSFQAAISITLSDFSNNPVLNSMPGLDYNLLEYFHRKKYSPPKLYLLKSSFLN